MWILYIHIGMQFEKFETENRGRWGGLVLQLEMSQSKPMWLL